MKFYSARPQLSRCLLAYTLLHRYASLPEWLALLGENPPTNLVELQAALWKF